MDDKMKIGGQLLPAKCPTDCPGKTEAIWQGGLCHRCPVFNCVPDEEGFSLLPPEDYRSDWAKAWQEWFDDDMKGLPKLHL